jgi:hypothetical protein
VRAVVVTGLQSLSDITAWHQGIRGSALEDCYAFAYDVLVEEAQGDSSKISARRLASEPFNAVQQHAAFSTCV